jgi:putative DNA methylase
LAAARAVIFAQMVDDPSAYVEVLRADPKLHRKAETALKARLKLWEEARALADRAKGTNLSVPEPGPAPTLDDMLADIERQRLFRIIEDLVLWENTANETVLQAARDEIWQSWRRACAENADHPRASSLLIFSPTSACFPARGLRYRTCSGSRQVGHARSGYHARVAVHGGEVGRLRT